MLTAVSSLVLLTVVAHLSIAQKPTADLGAFESHADIGTVLHPGKVGYDAANRAYTISGSGENMWFARDAFQFVWKKVSGDIALTADISFIGTGKNEHRKAVLMIRQSLDPDAPYADIALHGNGLTSLQFRPEKGANTHEVQSDIPAPNRLRIEKRGDYVYMSLSPDRSEPHFSGASIRLPFTGPFYVGIGLCSHDKDVLEKAVFSNVSLTSAEMAVSGQSFVFGGPTPGIAVTLYSTLETISVASTDRRVVYSAPVHFEAPNWTRDGSAFLFNQEGRILRLPTSGGQPTTIDTGFAIRCNNDHGISPDGAQLAISDQSQEDHKSLVYIVPIDGGAPRRITQLSPSYWHGWSPDGKTLAFVGERNGEFDIYSIPASGGKETRLTTAKGLDDGPEYSPDGHFIYFNSERTGHMQIWRMHPDGSEQQQITHDELNNWFPHISPDGKLMVFLSYENDVTGHPPNKNVTLRIMSLADNRITVLATLFGGQGTMNVPSWSPDSRQLAFVSYNLLPAP
jgi:TolB protein